MPGNWVMLGMRWARLPPCFDYLVRANPTTFPTAVRPILRPIGFCRLHVAGAVASHWRSLGRRAPRRVSGYLALVAAGAPGGPTASDASACVRRGQRWPRSGIAPARGGWEPPTDAGDQYRCRPRRALGCGAQSKWSGMKSTDLLKQVDVIRPGGEMEVARLLRLGARILARAEHEDVAGVTRRCVAIQVGGRHGLWVLVVLGPDPRGRGGVMAA